MAVQLLASEE